MSLNVYKIIHLLGLMLLFQSLGATMIMALSGTLGSDSRHRKMLMSMHGVGALLLLLGGFGMAARLGIMAGLPGWIWAKLVIWLLLGGSVLLIRKKPESAKLWWYLVVLLGLCAAFLGLFKPF